MLSVQIILLYDCNAYRESLLSIETKTILLAFLLLLRLFQVFYIFHFCLKRDLLLQVIAYITPGNSKAYCLFYFTLIVI